MKSLSSISFIIGFFFLVSTVCRAQENEPGADNSKTEQKAKLSEEDVAKFEPLFIKFMNTEDSSDASDALAVLVKAMDDYAEKNKVSSPVADDVAWAGMFERYVQMKYAKKKSYATGRIKTEVLPFARNGEDFAFEYSYYVPKNYDSKKSWPVLLCLHDKGAKGMGKDYIKKLWQGLKETKHLTEDFILVAPNLPEKLPKMKMKKRVGKKNVSYKTVPKRLKWFEFHHRLAMALPLVEILKQFNCDPERIFIEGVGEGADAAVTLAALNPGRFAGVISRHGRLREPKLLPGLQYTPALFLMREEGDFLKSSKGGEFKKALAEATEGSMKYDALMVESMPSMGKKSISLKLMGSQKTDPMMDANQRVTEFIAKHQLKPYPEEIRITSNHGSFRHHALVKITSHDIDSGEILDCHVKFDKETNSVELTGKHFFGASLFLNDSVLDLSKPVRVTVNGKIVDARVPDRSAKKMLQGMKRVQTDYHRVLPTLIKLPRFEWEAKEEEKKVEEK